MTVTTAALPIATAIQRSSPDLAGPTPSDGVPPLPRIALPIPWNALGGQATHCCPRRNPGSDSAFGGREAHAEGEQRGARPRVQGPPRRTAAQQVAGAGQDERVRRQP